MSEIVVKGKFDKPTLAAMHKKSPFKVGDVLVSRKGERFTVTKIFTERRYMPGVGSIPQQVFDIVGSKKGKVFTIYLD